MVVKLFVTKKMGKTIFWRLYETGVHEFEREIFRGARTTMQMFFLEAPEAAYI